MDVRSTHLYTHNIHHDFGLVPQVLMLAIGEGSYRGNCDRILCIDAHGIEVFNAVYNNKITGTIAYEMAQQLQAEGEEIDLLVMIQTRHPKYFSYPPHTTRLHRWIYRFADRIHYEGSNFMKPGLKTKVIYIGDRIERLREIVQSQIESRLETISGKSESKFAHSLVYALEKVAWMNRKAFWNYEAKPYRGHVVLFRASHQPRGVIPDPTLGWGRLVEGEFELYEMPAFHQTILLEPQVKDMAHQIRACFDKVIAQRET